MNARFCTSTVAQEAAGAIAAQEAIAKSRAAADSSVPLAWHAFATVAAIYGPKSPAAAAFIAELVKRAGAA